LRITVCYWKEKSPGEYGADKFPVFAQHAAMGKHSIYGLPSEEYPGHVKVNTIFF
jgi:sarcosine oxidase/L-pipecolate oxidase